MQGRINEDGLEVWDAREHRFDVHHRHAVEGLDGSPLTVSKIPPGFLLRCRGPACSWHLADPSITRKEKIAGALCRCFKIRCIGRKDLPARKWLSEYLNRSHVRELAAQAIVMVSGRSEPHAIVRCVRGLIPQDQHDLVLHVNRETSEHGPSIGR